MNNMTVKKNDGIINNCKIQENIIPTDNTTAPAVTKSKKVQATSLSLKPDVRQRLIDLSDACNMSKTEFATRLTMDSDSRIVSFPEGKEILTDIARCYQILLITWTTIISCMISWTTLSKPSTMRRSICPAYAIRWTPYFPARR